MPRADVDVGRLDGVGDGAREGSILQYHLANFFLSCSKTLSRSVVPWLYHDTRWGRPRIRSFITTDEDVPFNLQPTISPISNRKHDHPYSRLGRTWSVSFLNDIYIWLFSIMNLCDINIIASLFLSSCISFLSQYISLCSHLPIRLFET